MLDRHVYVTVQFGMNLRTVRLTERNGVSSVSEDGSEASFIFSRER